MVKLKFFLDFNKEEKWLNEMARAGYELVKIRLGYHFQPTQPQEAVYRIDYRTFRSQADFINYVTLFEDSGWQHVSGSRLSGAQYFKRLSPSSREDIFSDDFSRAERFKRLAWLWLALGMIELMFLLVLATLGTADLLAFVQPKRFYLTPGLWESQGAAFWNAFWFETPFAIFRAALLYFFPLALIAYTIFAVKSYRLYQKGTLNVS